MTESSSAAEAAAVAVICLKKAMQIALHMLSASHASLPEKTWNNTPGAGAAVGGAAPPAVAAVSTLILCCSLALLDAHLSRNVGRVRPASLPLPAVPLLLLQLLPFVSPILVDVAVVAEQARPKKLFAPPLVLLLTTLFPPIPLLLLLLLLLLPMLR